MMRKRIALLSVAGAAFAAAALFATPTLSQQVTLKLHVFIPPPANPYKTFLKPWADKVAKESNGKLKVELYPSMQLGGKPPQLLDQVKDGIVDIVWTLPGYTAGRFPKLEVFELPFVHKDPLSSTLALQDFQEKHLQEEFKDYKVLLLHVHAGSMFMTKRKAVTKLSDLKGLKIRTATRAGGWYLKSLGAVPIGAPLPKIPQMISKGVIEGAMLPYEIAPAIKMQELATHFTQLSGDQPRMNTSTFSFLMNKNSYNKLPADLKKVIDNNSGRGIAKWAGENWASIEKPSERVMRSKKKNRFHTMSAAEVVKMKAAAKPAIDRWLKQMKRKGIDGNALLADARAMIAKYAK
ncbi:MAG: TRAP transporter substrate-binding protein [Rhodospirillaceae bacterium]|nr:TRAP transporter substrate-binding protein [Rhodospirillaceae bacterium]MBT5456406.1 TRAP transporter substrate-binding protein [Rhodospirillaceae bacterium]